MLQHPTLQDSLAALARDSARALLHRDGVDLRYFPEAWFLLGLAVSIFAWCWRTWREVHGTTTGEDAAALRAATAEMVEAAARAAGAVETGEDGAPFRLRCPACDAVVGDTRAPLGYVTVCPACGRPIDVRLVEGRPRVRLRG